MKKIVVESHIPYIKGLIEPWAEVQYLAPEEITAEAVRDTDALVVRTRTRCNAALLDGSRCSFVGTATIGTDHIDIPYCENRGCVVRNAPGCNAPAVAQYVHAVIGAWLATHPLPRLTLGVVGVGHVGSIVSRWARDMGYEVLECDPPRADREGGEFVDIEEIARRADIITFHTPLTAGGRYPTLRLAGERFFSILAKCRLVINAARGGVVDEAAAMASGVDLAIDCWEHEPRINEALCRRAFVATPHIAGYSAEGKLRAVAMVISALNEHFGWRITPQRPPERGTAPVTLDAVMRSYDALADSAALKAQPGAFEPLRNNYPYRTEVL